MTTLQFPAKRITYPTTGDPIFSGDIRTGGEQLFAAINAILGDPSGYLNIQFLILSGLYWTGSQYTSGYIYYQGQVYFVPSYVATNDQYLQPTTTTTLIKGEQDGSSRAIYTLYTCTSISSPVTGMPMFDGTNMNSHRIGNYYLKSEIDAINALLPSNIIFGDNSINSPSELDINNTGGNTVIGNGLSVVSEYNTKLKGNPTLVNNTIAIEFNGVTGSTTTSLPTQGYDRIAYILCDTGISIYFNTTLLFAVAAGQVMTVIIPALMVLKIITTNTANLQIKTMQFGGL